MANSFFMISLGFLFALIDFTVEGFDILPDILGFVFFAIGLNALSVHNESFVKARNFNIALIVFALLHFFTSKSINIFAFNRILDFIYFLLSLLVVYNIFNGIKDISSVRGKQHLYNEAELRWKQYLMLHIAGFLSFILLIIPPLVVIYVLALLILNILYVVKTMNFMKRCGEQL